jgi:hypothetical protein
MIKKFLNDETGLELSEYAVAASPPRSPNSRRRLPVSNRLPANRKVARLVKLKLHQVRRFFPPLRRGRLYVINAQSNRNHR